MLKMGKEISNLDLGRKELLLEEGNIRHITSIRSSSQVRAELFHRDLLFSNRLLDLQNPAKITPLNLHRPTHNSTNIIYCLLKIWIRKKVTLTNWLTDFRMNWSKGVDPRSLHFMTKGKNKKIFRKTSLCNHNYLKRLKNNKVVHQKVTIIKSTTKIWKLDLLSHKITQQWITPRITKSEHRLKAPKVIKKLETLSLLKISTMT